MPTHRRLRVGLIGAGTIAFSAHLPAIHKLRDEIELVSVADIRLDNAERAAREYGAESHYSDYREMLERETLDFVDICTPEFLHADQVEAAASAGVHILCEKPMASTIAEADRMIAASERAGVRLMIAHSRRFTGRYQQIKAAIERGDIGEVRYFRENERRPRSMYDSLGLGTGYWNPESGRPWLTMAQFSQGAAMTNAVHETDLARWFVGQQPVSIYAESRITEEGAEVPDMLSYTIEFANGAVGASEIVNQLPPGYPYFHMTEVIGTDGHIRAIDPIMSPFTVANGQGIAQPVNFPALLHVDQAYVNELAAFIAALRDDAPLPITAQEARGAIELSVGAVLSSRRHVPVTFPLTQEEVDRG